jgi:hypothetical protein
VKQTTKKVVKKTVKKTAAKTVRKKVSPAKKKEQEKNLKADKLLKRCEQYKGFKYLFRF